MSSDIRARLAAVRERIASACHRAGRSESAVTLVAVCKGQPITSVLAALEAGQRVFAENYAQELVEKAGATSDREIEWHFVGGLQRNKIRKIVGTAALVQSMDSAPLAVEIDRRAAALGRVQDILVQVNIGDEAQKSGVAPEHLPALLDAIAPLSHLRCRGLMAIPPAAPDADASRQWFRALASLATGHGLADLSMGMSSDFEAAIEEGATLVRVGTAIFGRRPQVPGTGWLSR